MGIIRADSASGGISCVRTASVTVADVFSVHDACIWRINVGISTIACSLYASVSSISLHALCVSLMLVLSLSHCWLSRRSIGRIMFGVPGALRRSKFGTVHGCGVSCSWVRRALSMPVLFSHRDSCDIWPSKLLKRRPQHTHGKGKSSP